MPLGGHATHPLRPTHPPAPHVASSLAATLAAELTTATSQAMRESTRRIAAGEDPDKVNKSMSEGGLGSNRALRRASSKAKAKK